MRILRHNMAAWRRNKIKPLKMAGKMEPRTQNGGENGTVQTKNFAHQLQSFLTTFSAILAFFSDLYLFLLRAVVRGEPKYLTRPSAVWFLVAAGSTDHKHGLARR